MLLDMHEVLQRPAVVRDPKIRCAAFELIPHALHVEQIRPGVSILGEQGNGALCLRDLVGAEHVTRRFSVEVAVGEVHLSGLVHPSSSRAQVAGMLVYTRLEQVQIEASGRVTDRQVDLLQCFARLAAAVVILRGQHAHPHDGGGRLALRAAREGARTFE
eukprot:scaffold27823_cov129-Isochrysis_galbana.AAC.7